MQEKVCVGLRCAQADTVGVEALAGPHEPSREKSQDPDTPVHGPGSRVLIHSPHNCILEFLLGQAAAGASANKQTLKPMHWFPASPRSHVGISLSAKHVDSGLKWKVLHDH